MFNLIFSDPRESMFDFTSLSQNLPQSNSSNSVKLAPLNGHHQNRSEQTNNFVINKSIMSSWEIEESDETSSISSDRTLSEESEESNSRRSS